MLVVTVFSPAVEDHDQLLHLGGFRILDQQHTVETQVHLALGVEVGVVPVGADLVQGVLVAKALPRLDGRPHPGDTIHLPRHVHAVPVNRGGRVQRVVEVHDQPIPTLDPDGRTRHLLVVGETVAERSRRELDVHHLLIRVQVRRLGGALEQRTLHAGVDRAVDRAVDRTVHDLLGVHRSRAAARQEQEGHCVTMTVSRISQPCSAASSTG